jgi:hypothetical protein
MATAPSGELRVDRLLREAHRHSAKVATGFLDRPLAQPARLHGTEMARAGVRAITLLGTDSRAIDSGRCAAALLERLQYKFTLARRLHYPE